MFNLMLGGGIYYLQTTEVSRYQIWVVLAMMAYLPIHSTSSLRKLEMGMCL